MNISFIKTSEKDGESNSAYPFKINVSLNFSLQENQISVNKGQKTIKPDIKKVVQTIFNKIFDLTKDGQNKSIILEFENDDTLKEIAELERGKVLMMIYNYLTIISQMNNPFDKDGKRDLIKLTVKDLTKTLEYEERELSINMTNINLEFSFDYAELLNMLEGSTAFDVANSQ